MSRRYDNSVIYVPMEIYWGEDYVWKDGVCYAHLLGSSDYIITSQGDIISIRQENPRLLKTWSNQHGHQYIELYGNRYLVHRLVAKTFLYNKKNDNLVRHLDDEPHNNDYMNLSWGTAKDNRNDCVRNNHDFRKPVYCFETETIYRSCADAARSLGVQKSQITFCCQGKRGHAGGYHFCYESEMWEKKNDPSWLHLHSPYKPLVAYGPNGEVKKYNSRREAANDIGIPDCGISSVLSGHLKHTHGWRFEEGEPCYE